MASRKKIRLPKRRKSSGSSMRCVVRVTDDAYDALAEIVSRSGLSFTKACSEVLTQAVKAGIIEYIEEEEDEDEEGDEE